MPVPLDIADRQRLLTFSIVHSGNIICRLAEGSEALDKLTRQLLAPVTTGQGLFHFINVENGRPLRRNLQITETHADLIKKGKPFILTVTFPIMDLSTVMSVELVHPRYKYPCPISGMPRAAMDGQGMAVTNWNRLIYSNPTGKKRNSN